MKQTYLTIIVLAAAVSLFIALDDPSSEIAQTKNPTLGNTGKGGVPRAAPLPKPATPMHQVMPRPAPTPPPHIVTPPPPPRPAPPAPHAASPRTVNPSAPHPAPHAATHTTTPAVRPAPQPTPHQERHTVPPASHPVEPPHAPPARPITPEFQPSHPKFPREPDVSRTQVPSHATSQSHPTSQPSVVPPTNTGTNTPAKIQPRNVEAQKAAQNFIRTRQQQGGSKQASQPHNPVKAPQSKTASPSVQPHTQITPSVATHKKQLSTKSDHARSILQGRNPHRGDWFTEDFFHRHKCHPYYEFSGANWWWAPSWIAVADWLPYDWTTPYYYSDSGEPYEEPPEAYEIPPEQFVPPPEPNQNFLPLGVFAAAQSPDAAAYSTTFVQLAIDKEGNIAGTSYNSATDEVHELDGVVDEYTQEAAWRVSDNPNSPTMITGIYNLTQDAAIVQVNFTDGSVQPWVYVRLNK